MQLPELVFKLLVFNLLHFNLLDLRRRRQRLLERRRLGISHALQSGVQHGLGCLLASGRRRDVHFDKLFWDRRWGDAQEHRPFARRLRSPPLWIFGDGVQRSRRQTRQSRQEVVQALFQNDAGSSCENGLRLVGLIGDDPP